MTYLLHHSVEDGASRDPDREAFRFENDSLTYEALWDRARRLAAVLADQGVRRGDRVGIYMPKGLELPVAIYGILTAGAAYVPIDPAAPQSRVAFILEDCGIRHLVTAPSRRRQCEALASVADLRCVVGASSETGLDGGTRFLDWDAVLAAQPDPSPAHVTDQDLAYIMYTSGSTGTPKGLMHTHSSGLAYARYSARTYGVRPEDRLGNHAPLHFDISTFEYLTGPLCGATGVLIPEAVTMFPVSLGELIERERLTFWYSVPLALVQLLTRGSVEARDVALRWVIFGGEPLPNKHLWRLMELWPDTRFSNSYGPAEVNQCTYYHVPKGDIGSDEPVPIGRPWGGSDALVVDENLAPVSPGDAGELLIRSSTMMQGYWNRPDLNARAFHDIEAYPGFRNRFYRTGDLVRERDDGNLVFLGRKDRQVKVRGYRVELEEVESVLAAHPTIAEAAVVVVTDADDRQSIVASVLLGDDASPDIDDVLAHAARSLPPYAVPAQVMVLTEFPRTGTGKVDRNRLREQIRPADGTRE